jgi:glyoxylase-like metal-dependent hydrolase (beta-lactamase superfamily II)
MSSRSASSDEGGSHGGNGDQTPRPRLRLAQLGLGPENLDFVVFSHLHFDHAGNAQLFGGNGPRLVVNDLSQWYASVEKLRGIAEQSNANVIFGHDAEQLWSLRRSPDGHDT